MEPLPIQAPPPGAPPPAPAPPGAPASPLITIYRPVRRGDRWIARADVNTRGELIELQATASDRLANHARGWYNRAANWLGRYVQLKNGTEPRIMPEPGRGVFADLPQISYAVANQAIPFDEEVAAAADLFFAAQAGHGPALRAIQSAQAGAELGDEAAIEAIETLSLIEAASQRQTLMPVASLFLAAGAGDRDANKVLAALRETSAGAPTRIEWDVDEYMSEPHMLCSDIACACADEIGARIICPSARFGQVRRVRRSLEAPMLYTFRLIAAAYGG